MRTLPTISVIAVAAGLAGCTGDVVDTGAADAARKDTRAVERTVRTYLVAGARGEGRKACRVLGVEMRRAWRTYVQEEAPELGVGSCAEAFVRTARTRGAEERKVARSAKTLTFERVEVDGDRATVQAVKGGMTVELRRRDGKWRITGGLGL